jgi:serine protease AprX
MFVFVFYFVEAQMINEFVAKKYDKESSLLTQEYFKSKELATKQLIQNYLNTQKGPEFIFNPNGSFSQLFSFTSDGFPLYKSLDNLDALNSTRTNFMHTGLFSGLGMEGQGMTIGIWDGGRALTSHVEFAVSSSNSAGRMSVGDASILNGNSFHATHVAGTMTARGADLNAKGMAPQANIITFDWSSDENEAVTSANNGLLVSNHSYGVPMYNNDDEFQVPAWFPGSYSQEARDWDLIHYNFPYYIAVISAGNEGSRVNPNSFQIGFDKLNGNKNAKNAIVVANALDANVNTFTGLLNAAVAINSSSSQGPTDDFRVKPDITGNGTGLYSSWDTSNTSYSTISGTSMAAPNVSGSILLLQQYYFSLFNDYMRAATLKGIICHTADDAGNVGPDPVFGWGLLNMKIASEVVLGKNTGSAIVEERSLSQNETYTINFTLNSVENIKATISWTDVPGVANNGDRPVNDPTPALVNNLDLRIIKDGTEVFLPWMINPANVSSAIKGDNNIDNIEVVAIENAQPGNYQIVVSHKGLLSTPSQNYSLIFTGNNVVLNNAIFDENSFVLYPNPANDFVGVNLGSVQAESYDLIDLQGRVIISNSLVGKTNDTISLSGLQSGVYFVKVNSGTNSITKKVIKK